MNCPECGGPRLVAHPAGPCTFSHEWWCGLGAHEDARKVADTDMLACVGDIPFTRPTTLTEQMLMAVAAGVDPLDVPEMVTVTSVAGAAVVRREWDGLDPDAPEETTT